MGTPDRPPRPLRADAQKNRERILEAAATVFARDGLDASLDQVAEEAGVGVGTVYRRFPMRQDLINELFEEKIAKFVDLARECEAMDDPFEGLLRFLRDASRMHGEDVGLRQLILGARPGFDMTEKPRRTIGPIIGRLVEQAKANGDLREDFTTLDVPLIEIMLAQLNDLTGTVSPDLWERQFTMLADGLRQQRDETTPMPVDPITPDQYIEAVRAATERRRRGPGR